MKNMLRDSDIDRIQAVLDDCLDAVEGIDEELEIRINVEYDYLEHCRQTYRGGGLKEGSDE
jgi:hypothetical protein